MYLRKKVKRNLNHLSLAKNFMKSDVGKPLAKLLKHSDNI